MNNTISTTPIASETNANGLVNIAEGQQNKTNWTQYIFPGVLVLIFLVLLYYAYQEFVGNSEKTSDQDADCDSEDKEGFVEGNRQERSDILADFNIEEAIDSLEQMQSKILRELSQDSGL